MLMEFAGAVAVVAAAVLDEAESDDPHPATSTVAGAAMMATDANRILRRGTDIGLLISYWRTTVIVPALVGGASAYCAACGNPPRTIGDVNDPTPPPRQRGFLGHTSRAVYGTIVATAVIAAEASTLQSWGPWEFLATLLVTVVVLWFAEIYSDVLGDATNAPLSARIRKAADEHTAVLEAAVPLGIPLLLGGIGVLDENTAVYACLSVAVVALGVWGGLSARNRGGGTLQVTTAAVFSALIGVVIIILKSLH